MAEEVSGAVMADLTCSVHGAYQAWRSALFAPVTPIRDCPKCLEDDLRAKTEAKRAEQAKRMRGDRLKEIHGVSGIPKRFEAKSFTDYRATMPGQRTAQHVCQRFADGWADQLAKGGSLVLTGMPGTGKTHLACAIANQIMPDHLASVRFGSVSSIIRGIRSTYSGKGNEIQAIADLLLPDLLIIDEIGAQIGSDHELQLLFEIINKRYENLRPMILISNLNQDELLKYLGHRAMDRFRECGTVLAFEWESYRGSMAAIA